ncbi:MAG: hypothetical protein AMS16_06275 [Planctomycetes bacterium DG_58]|nr:MAG: hypothetical protein AMS16_06275 [Planctomycetes bacterium DG_58]KPL00198.1 MAG: hypothetical protein AMK75_05785 [Planctomycetes bacterium SM23_65]
MRFDYPSRVKIGVVLLLLVTLYGGCKVIVWGVKLGSGRPGADDRITVYERRFEELKKDLPADAVVGYVSDKTAEQPSGGKPFTGSDVLLTQYALAPVIVSNAVKTDLVVGNFQDPRNIASLARKEGLVLVRDYGLGVALFKRKGE